MDKESEDIDMNIRLKYIEKKKRRGHKQSHTGDSSGQKKDIEDSSEVLKVLQSLVSKVNALGKM